MEAVEWLEPFKRYTERLREHVEHRTLEETVAYAAQETNLSWDTVKEIDKARLRRLYEHFHWDNSRRLAVDEFAIHRGHRYKEPNDSFPMRDSMEVGNHIAVMHLSLCGRL